MNSSPSSNSGVAVIHLENGSGTLTGCDATGIDQTTISIRNMAISGGVTVATGQTDRYFGASPPRNSGVELSIVTNTGGTLIFFPSTPSEANNIYSDDC